MSVEEKYVIHDALKLCTIVHISCFFSQSVVSLRASSAAISPIAEVISIWTPLDSGDDGGESSSTASGDNNLMQ